MKISPTSLFSIFAHDTRLRCLLLLLRHDELCVCELTHPIGASQPHLSRHLAQLREAGLVEDRRDGLWIYYRINPKLPIWIAKVLSDVAEGIGSERKFLRDLRALNDMPKRPGAARGA